MILNIGGGGGVKPRIVVTAPTGSDVTVSKGSTILYAPEVSGTWTFNVPEQGDWSATAILGSKTASKTVSVSKVGVYNVTLRYVSATLNDNSWEDIKGVADASEGQNYWAVGDTKQITINGKLSDGLTLSNYQTWVYIIGFDHNKDVEGTGIAFQGFKTAQTGGTAIALCDSGYYSSKTSGTWFNINNSNETNGGWKSSLMRNNVMPLIKSSFPVDLQNVIKSTVLYSNNVGYGSAESNISKSVEEVYLTSLYETVGADKDSGANQYEANYQTQYEYYSSGNSSEKYNHSSTTSNVKYWSRSPSAENSDRWMGIYYERQNQGEGRYSFGIAPAFKVGTTPIFPTLNDNSWSAIAKVAYTSEGANYWSVGDTKEITLNGKLSDGLTLSNYKTWVYILGFDHNEAVEGKGIVFGGFKTAQTGGTDIALIDSQFGSSMNSGQWFNMNNNNNTTDGWASCNMRNNTLPVVKAALPGDLQSVLKTSTIYTDNTGGTSTDASYVTATHDELYLLAEFEIFGVRYLANSEEQNYQQQYAYYTAGNSKIKYRFNDTATGVVWGERSVRALSINEYCSVYADGNRSSYGVNKSNGFAPAFRVCYTPPSR